MTRVSLEMPADIERRLREKARNSGQTLEAYLQQLVARHALAGAETASPAPKSFDEILAPVREGFAECGMTEDELNELFEEARDEAWQERQRRKGAP
jgi:hypothetical protein